MIPSQPPELEPGSVKLLPPASPAFDPVAVVIPITATNDDTPPPTLEVQPLGVPIHVKKP